MESLGTCSQGFKVVGAVINSTQITTISHLGYSQNEATINIMVIQERERTFGQYSSISVNEWSGRREGIMEEMAFAFGLNKERSHPAKRIAKGSRMQGSSGKQKKVWLGIEWV